MRFTPGANGYESIFLDYNHTELTKDYTFKVNEDCGKVFSSSADGLILSLPRIKGGQTLTLFNTGLDERCELFLFPAADNGIMYAGKGKPYTKLVNTRATQKRGDYIKLATLDARYTKDNTLLWHVVESRGVWEHI